MGEKKEMHSHEKLEYTDITFYRKTDHKSLSIRLYSHYTCILGDSGIGKSCFFDTIADNAVTQEIEVHSQYPLVPTTAATLETVLEVEERRIIMIDEANVFSQQGHMMNKINRSKHLFLCIGRSSNCNGDYPLQGIYELSFDGTDWFHIQNVFDLNATNVLQKDMAILTESKENRSEHELLGRYFHNIQSARGRNNIQSKLLMAEDVVVFADLGNIGRAYRLLKKRVKDRPGICFYDYQSFEQLLYDAPVLEQFHTKQNDTVFDAATIEAFYESVLEKETAGCEQFAYRHGKPLAPEYVTALPEKLFQSDIGAGILKALQSSLDARNETEK